MNSPTALPLLPEGTGPVARLRDGLVDRARFIADIHELSVLLPDRGYVVNFCADRYRFVVGWAAAMVRHQVTLLPPGRDSASVSALEADYPALYVLADDEESCAMSRATFRFPALQGAAAGHHIPAFPPDQVAAVLFTSGSTGRPQPSVRRWGRLVAASRAAGAALGIERSAGAALVATVPHGHSYGLESAVVLPLQHGLLLTPDRPFFPADVIAALSSAGPHSILVTTPVHLQALTQDANGGRHGSQPVRAGLVLSATAPLPTENAAAAETLFNAPVFEIYGCSEAGQLASRRTVEGPVWRCLDGFHLRHDPAGCWACGPYEADVLLADQIEPAPNAGFVLKGRTADLVNVAGKRSSLAHLTHELTAIEGVVDGVFLHPAQSSAGATSRLLAVAVAPGLDAATILARLRGRIDPAFLPRPLFLLEQLPRNALGKLPQSDLFALIAAAKPSDKVATPDPAPIELRVPAALAAAKGHFPGNPIVPGAVLLDHLVTAFGPDLWCGGVDYAKFHHPVRPGDTLSVLHRNEGDAATRFECRLAGSGQLVLSGALRSSSPSR